MFCENCGKENNEGNISCQFCGQNFVKTASDNISGATTTNITNSNKQKLNRVLIISVAFIFVLSLSVVLFIIFRTNTPDVEQIKKDFIEEIFDNKEYSINEFKVLTENDEKNDKYTAIAEIVYDNTNVEYHRQYKFIYEKYNEWVLNDISAYKKDAWQIFPISAPVATDYIGDCEAEVSDEIKYDKFTPVDSKTTADLDSGKATFVFNVEKNTKIQNITGEIEFAYTFNDEIGEWELSDYSYSDSYRVQYNLINTWVGDGYPYLFTDSEEDKVNFEFEITNYKNDTVDGILKYDNESYDLSGKVTNTSGSFLVLDLSNKQNKKSISLFLEFDGTATADIDIQYIPNQIVYFGYMKSQFKEVKMTLK